MKFRRKQKLFPGVHINLSKSGISTTVGIKGLNVNIGKKGTYLNTGITGTGIYDRKKIGSKNNQQKENSNNTDELKQEIKGEIKSKSANEVTSKGLSSLKDTLSDVIAEKISLKKELKVLEPKVKKSNTILILSRILIIGFFIKKIKIKRDNYKLELEEIKKQFKECKLNVNISLDEDIKNSYMELENSFNNLAKSKMIWDLVSKTKNNDNRSSAGNDVMRKQTTIGLKEISIIESEFKPLFFNNINGDNIYIFPTFVLIFGGSKNFGVIELKEFRVSFRSSRFIEQEKIPKDSKIIDHTWFKTNKNGSPDKRFKGNYKIPIVNYGQISFKSDTGINEEFLFSNRELAEEFYSKYNEFIKLN